MNPHERWERRRAHWHERHAEWEQRHAEHMRWHAERRGRRPNALLCYVRSRLHRRMFMAFGAAILLTGVAVTTVMNSVGSGPSWRDQVAGAGRFVAGRFAQVWSSPAGRAELAGSMAREMNVDVILRDPHGASVGWYTPEGERGDAPGRCRHRVLSALVEPSLGAVEVCADRHHPESTARRGMLALLAAGAVLWALSGSLARRIARPLEDLARVVTDIGQGKLSSRMRLPRGREGADEIGQLAGAVNDMAERIERQIEDQRQLLAAVSHELRSPLARMRFMLELMREGVGSAKQYDEFEREMVGIDALVGDLLANARLDFSTLAMVPLEASKVALGALETLDIDPTVLTVEGESVRFEGDATLVACAVSNLVTNAQRHGGGLRALRVGLRGTKVFFEAEDGGEGFAEGEADKLFEPFYRGERARREKSSGVGLGLSLVKRIATAHGGRAWAENIPGGGARVGIELRAVPA